VNLLRNALDAVPASGQICVSARPCTREGARSVAVCVEDDGPGIPPEVLPDIFDAFVSSRLDSRGTGLGLTVAEGIVQQHGGTISASNRPGGGARLEVILRSAA
jgi:signal transduction histidine kinase